MNKDQQDLRRLDEAIKALRITYEKYFIGLEKLEPVRERDRVKAMLRDFKADPRNMNTARRFQLQQLTATLVTHQAYWTRICRKIEEGTFKRDVKRAQKQQAAHKAPAAQKKPGPENSHSDVLVSLHRDYEKARQQTGVAKDVSIDALARTIAKQTAAIKERYKCKGVDFRVAVKDGKAILKAMPR